MRSIAWIHERCTEDADCMLWQGSTDCGNRPKMTVRDPDLGKTRTVQPRRLVWEEAKGPIPAKRYVTVCCDNPLCLNPDHLKLVTRGQVVARVAQRPDTQRRRHLAGLKRREFSDRSLELAQFIRASTESGAELSRQTGIPATTISAIRLNKRWREYSNPFSGLGGL